jgi:hypothetical protein
VKSGVGLGKEEDAVSVVSGWKAIDKESMRVQRKMTGMVVCMHVRVSMCKCVCTYKCVCVCMCMEERRRCCVCCVWLEGYR